MKFIKKGFTLVELLVVIGILAVLAGGLVVAIDPQDKLRLADDTKAMNDGAQIASAIQAYVAGNSAYPPNTTPSLETNGDLTKVPVAKTGYTYTYTTNAGFTAGKFTTTLKAKKNTAANIGTWCWDSALATAQVYKAAATATLGSCP